MNSPADGGHIGHFSAEIRATKEHFGPNQPSQSSETQCLPATAKKFVCKGSFIANCRLKPLGKQNPNPAKAFNSAKSQSFSTIPL
jgi:hypothetical protein